MSRCWINGTWYNCKPNSKIRYLSESEDEKEIEQKIVCVSKEKLVESKKKQVETKEDQIESKSKAEKLENVPSVTKENRGIRKKPLNL